MAVQLDRAMEETTQEIDEVLRRLFAVEEFAERVPSRLLEAMRYAAFGGGKRVRPFLVLECASLFAVPREQALTVAAAVELMHCYSLAHDDLPAMDDDDLRRGKPSLHRRFDEATAILAGNALMALAFELVTDARAQPDPALRIELGRLLASVSGARGLIGGQLYDLALEGRFGAEDITGEMLERTLSMKTAALFRFSCESAAVLAGCSASQRTTLALFGEHIGMIYQMMDDLEDAALDPSSHASFNKLFGEDVARERIVQLCGSATEKLASFGEKADTLRLFVDYLRTRAAKKKLS